MQDRREAGVQKGGPSGGVGENARLREQVMESKSCEDRSQLWCFLFNLLHSGSSGRWSSVVSSLVYMGKSSETVSETSTPEQADVKIIGSARQ